MQAPWIQDTYVCRNKHRERSHVRKETHLVDVCDNSVDNFTLEISKIMLTLCCSMWVIIP